MAADPAPPPPAEAAPPEPQEAAGPASPVTSARGTLNGRWRALSRMPIIMMLSSVLLGLGIVQLTFQIGNSIYRSVTWQNETRATLQRVSALQSDVKILQDAERWATDPGYLEQLARCQGFVGRNESVIVSSNAPAIPGESCAVVRLP